MNFYLLKGLLKTINRALKIETDNKYRIRMSSDWLGIEFIFIIVNIDIKVNIDMLDNIKIIFLQLWYYFFLLLLV